MQKDINMEAKRIIGLHTAGYMHATCFEPDTDMELWEAMVDECAYILTNEFLGGRYTPMEYNAIRNEIANILNAIFDPVCSPVS